MAQNTTTDTNKESDKLVISVQLKKGSNMQPFIDAWNAYAQKPENTAFSNAGLAMHFLAQGIGFDLTSIDYNPRGANTGVSKEDKEKAKKLVSMAIKTKDIGALAKYLIRAGQDVSSILTPTEEAQYRKEIAAEDA